MSGEITEYIDWAQVVLYVFWIFFFGLIAYLQCESRREGYPLESATEGQPPSDPGPLYMPDPKTFKLQDGTVVLAPGPREPEYELKAVSAHRWETVPLTPTGDPLVDGVGPAAWSTQRPDIPEHDHHGNAKIVPMREAEGFDICDRDPDPRGMAVVTLDGETVGTCCDVWIDVPEQLIRYYEVDGSDGRKALVPMPLARIDGKTRTITVESVNAAQFRNAPMTKAPNRITLLEEDRITAYFGGGHLYATPARMGPLI